MVRALSTRSPFSAKTFGMRVRFPLAVLLAGLFGSGCGGAEPRFPEPTGPLAARASSKEGRKSVAITVYNQGFGVVREVRDVTLAEGRVALEWKDVSAQVRPQTVHIRSLSDPAGLRVLEQNYRYDLLGPQKLLEKYVGKKIKVYRWNEARGAEEAKDAEVLAVQNGVVLKIDGEVTFNFPGRFAFPEVPKNLIDKPTLALLLASRKPKAEIEVSYLSGGLDWEADYVFVVNEDDTRGDLTGWVTLSNTSGASYEDATLKLVAGDVQTLQERERVYPQAVRVSGNLDAAQQFREEGFFEYHLYTLERPTTLLDKETKQVSLLEARDAGVKKKLVLRGFERFFRVAWPLETTEGKQKVGVYLELDNSAKNGLGMPLPKGVVRVYKADKSGAKQFIGEDRIDHTPRDEKITVKLGDSFDVVAERKQTEFDVLGQCENESSFEISLRNHKDKKERVEVEEPANGDWKIVESTQPARKKDARTFVFDVDVPARGEVKVKYTVRVRYC
jgi:hypothetical protein